MAAATTDATTAMVRGYPVRLDRAYERSTHVWVQDIGGNAVRIGLDPLGVEINGTLAQLSLLPPGEQVRAGAPFGHLEAAKFVGPLVCPVGGVVTLVNPVALERPGLVERDPYGAGWLIELSLDAPLEGAELISDRDAIIAWFARKVEDYRTQGVLAE